MKRLSVLVLVAALMSAKAGEAATIIFDHCTFASACGAVTMDVKAEGIVGDVQTYVQVFAQHPIWLINDVMLFGLNTQPGMTFSGPSAVIVTSNAISHPIFGEFPFSVDLLGNDSIYRGFSFTFVPGDGHVEVNPFEPNAANFMAIAHVRNMFTAEEGFVATGPFAGQQADLVVFTPVPEPASVILFATGLAALGRTMRRRRM